MNDNLVSNCALRSPSIVVGVTTAQTCLILRGRVSALRKAGFRVTLISAPSPMLDSFAERQGVEAAPVPIERQISLFADLVSLYRLWRLLRRLRPDVVEFSTPKAGLLGLLAAKICRVPCRVYLLRGLKLETTTGLKRRILLAAERLATACAQVVVCNSESLRTRVVELQLGAASRFVVLGAGSSSGVDTENFSPATSGVRSTLGIPSDAPVIGFVGRLTHDKGIVELLAAFERILAVRPDARLLFVGWFDEAEDALSPLFRRQIEEHPQMILTGLVDSTVSYYRAMDLLVLPTWREGFPNVALEASATGVPVITTEATGARDAVIPGVTGLRIPPGSPEAISGAVLQLLQDPERRALMGKAGREWAQKNYAEAHVLGDMVDFYKKLIARSKAG